MRNKFFTRIIITTLLVTLLTFNVGRVTRVHAVATTASIVGTVLLGLGVTYIAYQTLTGAYVYVPDLSEDQSYITDLGRKFSMTASGNRLFQDLYNHLIADNTYSVMDFTVDRLQDIYNDHKSILDMQFDSSFPFQLDYALTPLNGFDYNLSFTAVPDLLQVGVSTYTFDEWLAFGTIDALSTNRIIYKSPNRELYGIFYINIPSQVRNVFNGTSYTTEYFDGSVWTPFSSVRLGYEISDGLNSYYAQPMPSFAKYTTAYGVLQLPSIYSYPALCDAPVYDSVNDEYLPLVPVDTSGNQITPNYPQNDNNDGSKYPLVPFVELPSTLKWGFNWRDALTDLINGGSRLITSAWLADLINDFKSSLSGTGDDINYNFYNQGDTYYFTYYSDVVNDIYNPIYNINIEGQDDVIPVDLNTIEQYTDNVYLDVVRERVDAFSDTVGSFVAFWHNIDYEIVYAVFGSALIVLLGAFIGKWGHS